MENINIKIEQSSTNISVINDDQTEKDEKKRLKNWMRRQRYKQNKRRRKEQEMLTKLEEQKTNELLIFKTPCEKYIEEEEKLDLIDFNNIIDEDNLQDIDQWKNFEYKIKLRNLNRKIRELINIEDKNEQEKKYKEYAIEKKYIKDFRYFLLNDEEKEARFLGMKRRFKIYNFKKKLKKRIFPKILDNSLDKMNNDLNNSDNNDNKSDDNNDDKSDDNNDNKSDDNNDYNIINIEKSD